MISAAVPSVRLVQRLRARAERLAANRAASRRSVARSAGADWRSATSLWPEFTADITAADPARN